MQTIGERLEEARKRKGVSIREAAEATKIRGDYLQKFEANQFDIELAEIYVRGFLRSYSHFLKLPAERILGDYEALGRGKSRVRQPSREVYGRMDLSISNAEERESRQEREEPAPAPQVPDAEPAARPGSTLSQPGSSLPKAPAVDPALVFRALVGLAAVIAVLLIILLVKSILFGGRSAESRPAPAPAQTAAPAQVVLPPVTLIGLDRVHVTVIEVGSGQVLSDTTLDAGQRLVVQRPGAVIIQADVGANVQFEVSGRRYAMPPNHNRIRLE